MGRPSRFRKSNNAADGTLHAQADFGETELRLMIRVAIGKRTALGPGKVRLMELIDQHGSVSAASRAMGMSYRRAWLLINSLNGTFPGGVVMTQRGGREGGGAKLTPVGRELVDCYRKIESKARASVDRHFQTLQEKLARIPIS